MDLWSLVELSLANPKPYNPPPSPSTEPFPPSRPSADATHQTLQHNASALVSNKPSPRFGAQQATLLVLQEANFHCPHRRLSNLCSRFKRLDLHHYKRHKEPGPRSKRSGVIPSSRTDSESPFPHRPPQPGTAPAAHLQPAPGSHETTTSRPSLSSLPPFFCPIYRTGHAPREALDLALAPETCRQPTLDVPLQTWKPSRRFPLDTPFSQATATGGDPATFVSSSPTPPSPADYCTSSFAMDSAETRLCSAFSGSSLMGRRPAPPSPPPFSTSLPSYDLRTSVRSYAQ